MSLGTLLIGFGLGRTPNTRGCYANTERLEMRGTIIDRARPPQKEGRIGIDTGGTFTDFVRLDEDGITVDKRRSIPDDPSCGILEGITSLTEKQQADAIIHGSTVATNAVLERKGARVALLATRGFEDVLAIGRQTRPELYNIFVAPRRPIVEAGLVFGVPERLDADGKTLIAVDGAEV